jgi:predicted small secreted protein
MVRKVLLAVLLAVLAYSLIGCQTVQGVGRDITWVGEKVGDIFD